MTVKRGSARHATRFRCAPDDAWGLLGAPGRVHEWFPGIDSCTVDGDQRVVVTGSGIPLPEQLLTVDPVLRRFQYRITAPLFTEHLSTIDVHDLGDGTCLVVYSVRRRSGPPGPGHRRRGAGRAGGPGRPAGGGRRPGRRRRTAHHRLRPMRGPS